MNILLQTTFTPYSKTTVIKPGASIFSLELIGQHTLEVNNVKMASVLFYDQSKINFALNSIFLQVAVIKNALAGKEKIDIINDTQFEVNMTKVDWINDPVVYAIETTVKIEK